MFKAACFTLALTTSSALAVPKFFADFANSQHIDADKLYAVLLSESGVENSFGHLIPWPWSVTVDGRYYQFKTRNELFAYLTKSPATANIRYGIAGRPLTRLTKAKLWDVVVNYF